MNETIKLQETVKTLLDNQSITEAQKNLLFETWSKSKNQLSEIFDNLNAYTKMLELEKENGLSNNLEEFKETFAKTFANSVSKGNDNLNKFTEIIEQFNNSNNSGSSSNTSVSNLLPEYFQKFSEILTSYQDWLKTLPLHQQLNLLNIWITVFLLFCFISLITIFYSEFLIKYFELETKFQKNLVIIKFIQLK